MNLSKLRVFERKLTEPLGKTNETAGDPMSLE